MHDKDINELTGEPKKPHWHIIISFSIKKSYKQAKLISELLNAPEPQSVGSLQGSVQYLWHKGTTLKNISIIKLMLLHIMALNTDNT